MLNKLHPRLQDFVKDNFKNGLTPIQQKAFDPIFSGESCIIEAPTSGGKTEAVLFPLLTRIAANRSRGIKVLYIAPLKALLNDLALRVVPHAKRCYMEAFKWHGDVSQGEKIQQMIFPSDILLTTPESIEAILLRKSNWVEIFNNLQAIVIDEAHYFALTERGSHLVSLLERIEHEIAGQPQRIAVTATIGNPEDLLRWLMGNRPGGIRLKVDSDIDKSKDFKIHYFDGEGEDLFSKLYNLLPNKKSIVFQNSRSLTEYTAGNINERNISTLSRIPVKVKTHHSSVSKRLREDAEVSIKMRSENSVNVIISTSTLELGIDIGELDQVIQVGGLNSSGSFLQRVGRTGRRADRAQFFRGLCDDEEELLLLTACVNLGLKKMSENISFPKKAFHIMAHQVICICLQKFGTRADQIWNILSKASAFSVITRDEFDCLIEHMIQNDFLRLIDNGVLVTGNQTENEYLRANWKRLFAIFDTGPMYNVVDGKKIIGTLDSSFVRAQELPFLFVLGGQEWNVIKVNHETQQVSVIKNLTGTAPKWKAISSYDIPFEVSQECGRILMNVEQFDFLDRPAEIALERQRESHRNMGWNNLIWVFDSMEETKIYIWTFAGDKINRTLATLLSDYGHGKHTSNHKYVEIEFRQDNPVSINEIADFLIECSTLRESQMEDEISDQIKVHWFSKFSPCLPEELAKKVLREKGLDLSGLLRELNKVQFKIG